MLATLHDPVTALDEKPLATAAAAAKLPSADEQGGVRVVHVNGYPGEATYQAYQKALAAALVTPASDHALVVDLRGSGMPSLDQIEYLGYVVSNAVRGQRRERACCRCRSLRAGTTSASRRKRAPPAATIGKAERPSAAPVPRRPRRGRTRSPSPSSSTPARWCPMMRWRSRGRKRGDLLRRRFIRHPAGRRDGVRRRRRAHGGAAHVRAARRNAGSARCVGCRARVVRDPKAGPSSAAPPAALTTSPDKRFADTALPDEPHRVLAAFRVWGTI